MATTAAETKAKKASSPTSAPLASYASQAKHVFLVELYCPPGASEGLSAFIAMAETAIQTAVDLLGRGMTTPPPNVDDLLQPEFYKTLGSGEADEQYRKNVDKVEARQLQLLQMDNQVIKTSVTVAAEQVRALKSIQHIVDELNVTLKRAGTGKLKPKDELPYLKAVADAVERVYDKITAIADLNENMANGNGNGNSGGSGSSSGGGTSSGTGASGGGGDGGLSSLLPMLAMLPMAAMPLISQIPEMMQKAEEDKAKKAEENQHNGAPGKPGQAPPPGQQPAAAPTQGDPNAQPAGAQPATAQPGGVTAAPAANTAPPGEQDGAPAATGSPGVIQARRTKDVSAADRPGAAPTQDATAEDEPDHEASAVIDV
ncbi:hypothetical protein ACIA5H_02600 [Nocardia sp. NPDC051900]|uniref:hypothetical protein n=1 Tax=Nocardia sp. NPDC051900 TaxID=3364326 RepID=UPI00379730CC